MASSIIKRNGVVEISKIYCDDFIFGVPSSQIEFGISMLSDTNIRLVIKVHDANNTRYVLNFASIQKITD